ncbi:hypothetical protein [Rhizomonospora bruguierae]|uniref:hypothetical protein n=1 Tax=Rhizomonospora bruguierae TaxID=1581705 RepID=UPI001BCEC023|nr:hypothetical protein [Micromonospora sp. NBRC 107566]
MVERSQPRHVDRRDQGIRRQRRITQWSAVGSAALIAGFGWIFARPDAAAAGNGGSTGTVESTPAPTPPPTKAPAKTAPTGKAQLTPPPAAPKQTTAEPAPPPPHTRTGAS